MRASVWRFVVILLVCLKMNNILGGNHETKKDMPSSSVMKSDGFVAQLIHITSPLSPLYNPNATIHHLQNHSIAISAARNKYLFSSDKALAAPSNHDFVMRFSLGLPPADAFGIPDTASDLIWLECPTCPYCEIDNQTETFLYDPANSYSHHYLPCYSEFPISCSWFPNSGCSPDKYCSYDVNYPDTSSFTGTIGVEHSFSFQNANTSTVINPLYFGCGTNNFDSSGQDVPGVIGLRRNSSISLIGSLSNPSFSYCHDAAGFGGYIRFGSETIFQKDFAYSTPLRPDPVGNYIISLESIYVSEKADPTVVNDVQVDGELIIDTGTTYTLLDTEIFDKLLSAINNTHPLVERKTYPNEFWELCYDDITDAPLIQLSFTTLDFNLSNENAWVGIDDGVYCLAMQRSPTTYSVLGMYQQRGQNVGFDLQYSQVWFAYQGGCPM